MNKRERLALMKRRAELIAAHAELRRQIEVLRPAWSTVVLESIQQSYGTVSGDGPAAGLPGLRGLLNTIVEHDAIAARFGVAS